MERASATEAPSSAQEAHDAVVALLESGEVDQAGELFRQAFKRWRTNSKLRLLKGDVLARTAGPAQAALHYANLLDDPGLATWAGGRLLTLLRDHKMQIKPAVKLARRIRDWPADAKLKGLIFDRLIDATNETRREPLLEYLAQETKVFRYESKLAIFRAESGDFQSALAILERARTEGRSSVHGDLLLSDLLTLDGRLSQAIDLLESLLVQHPEHADLHRRLTMLQQRAGHFARAADLFEAAVRRWPHDWMLLYRLNRLPVEHDRLKDIVGVISKNADEPANRNDRFRFWFALACLHVGEIGRALELLQHPFQEPIAGMAAPVMKALRARAPQRWISGSRLADDRTREVQITRASDARATIVLTTGIAFGNLPLSFADTLFADHGLNVVYLRDFIKRAYLRGIATLGATEADTIVALKQILGDLGAPRTIVMGSSSGGFSAMRYAALLKADYAVSFSGPTAMTSYYDNTRVSVWNPDYFIRAQLEREGELPLDLVPVLGDATHTQFIQFYGEHSTEDARQARRLEGLPRVIVTAIPGVTDHYVVDHMIGDGAFDALLERLAGS
jgi:tetratricopeptide (TPR) repeat protein